MRIDNFVSDLGIIKRRTIAKELADTIIYADLLAARLDINLEEALIVKFNEVSVRMNSDVFL